MMRLICKIKENDRRGISNHDRWIAGIRWGHQITNAPWYGSHLLSQAKKGVGDLSPATSWLGKCWPVTLRHLDACREHLDLTNSFDATVYVVACVAFWACCRLGELITTSWNAFDAQANISHSCLKTLGVARYSSHFSMIHLPSMKTKGSDGDDIYLMEFPFISSPINTFI